MRRACGTLCLVAAACALPATASAQGGAGFRLDEPMAVSERSFAERSPFSFFGQAGMTLDLRGAEPSPSFAPGFGVALRLGEGIGIGLRSLRFGFGDAFGGQLAFQAGGNVYVEPSVFVDPRVQLYAQVGPTIVGGTRWDDASPFVDVDLTVRAGVRFWITDWLTIAIEAGFDVRLTEPTGLWSRSQGDIAPYAGITVGFHF